MDRASPSGGESRGFESLQPRHLGDESIPKRVEFAVAALFLNIYAAWTSLREQRQRAALSALGITVGSVAIVLLISIAKGVQADITNQVNDLGVNLLVVLPFRVADNSMFSPNAAGMSYLNDDDVRRVRAVAGVRRAAPLVFAGGGVRYRGKASPSTFIIAADPDWFKVRPVELSSGHTFTHEEEDTQVCVIGSVARDNLFGTESPVGRTVTINSRKYRVVGVTRDKKADDSLFSMGGFENIAYIPFKQFRQQTGNAQIHRIMVQTAPDVEPKQLVSAVDRALGERLDRQLYSVLTQKDLLKLVYKLMSILTWLLTGLTSIALFVGGIGIMAVMLMSVNERAKEIGIRKTVGARTLNVFQQFLAEAVMLGAIGSLIGLAISGLVCYFLFSFTPIKPMITWPTVVLSFLTCVGVGGIFGLIPALSAARKDPVEALRRE